MHCTEHQNGFFYLWSFWYNSLESLILVNYNTTLNTVFILLITFSNKSENIIDLVLFRHLTFWQETFQHGHFIKGTFRHRDFSASLSFIHLNISSRLHGHFGKGTFRHVDFLAQGHLGTGTFWHGEFSAWDITARVCFVTRMFQHHAQQYGHFSISPCAKNSLC